MPASAGAAPSSAKPRILLIGDVMTDVIVRPEGPLARGSDRRASIAVEPGGSAANQAAWLASFGVAVDLVARVGAADVEVEAARLAEAGVTPHLVGDPERPTGRLVALIDPSGERSFFTDRGANEALAAADIPDALVAGASMIHLSGYSFFAPSPREAVLDVMRRAGGTPVSVDPASAEFLREVGPQQFLAMDEGRGDPLSQRGRGRGPDRRRRSRDAMRAARRALPARRPQARRKRLRRGGGRGALADRGARASRRSTRPARATPSSPLFSPHGCKARRSRPRSSARSPRERTPRRGSADGRMG